MRRGQQALLVRPGQQVLLVPLVRMALLVRRVLKVRRVLAYGAAHGIARQRMLLTIW